MPGNQASKARRPHAAHSALRWSLDKRAPTGSLTGRGEHTLCFQHGYACPSHAELVALANEWGVADAAHIVAEVLEAVGGFAATAETLKVRHPNTLHKACADVGRRIDRLSP